jgi:hypothetical protein
MGVNVSEQIVLRDVWSKAGGSGRKLKQSLQRRTSQIALFTKCRLNEGQRSRQGRNVKCLQNFNQRT